jgi:nucleotide-binding universal stress UspA family protein
MARILTCTDGSVYAHSVYHYSAWAAKRLDAEVHVLHMLDPLHDDPLNADFSGSIGLGARTALMDELVRLEATRAKIAQKRGQAILDDAEERLREAGVAQVSTMQRHERLSDSIAKYDKEADLIVLGKRGNHADFSKGHLGSNLERVIRSCKHPVLVASTAVWPMQRFVFAYDSGPSANKAVDYLVAQPLLKGLDCHLLCVGKAGSKHERSLREAESKLTEAGYQVDADLQDGDADEVIAEAINREGSDLLVMGAFGHSRIRQMIVGSTTTAMIRGTKRPVLLFR